MRKLLSAVIVAGAMMAASAANAATATYDLTLTPTSGSVSGTGAFTINSTNPGSNTFFEAFSANVLQSLSFTMSDGTSFDLSNDGLNNASVKFTNGVVSSISYSAFESVIIFSEDLATTLLTYDYTTSGIFGTHETKGNITVTPELSAVPLPAALPMFGAGLAGLGLLARRRKKATAVAA